MMWQYQTVLFEFSKNGLLGDRYMDDEEIEKTLNTLGKEGWELVNVSLLEDGLLAILKQPHVEQQSSKHFEQSSRLHHEPGPSIGFSEQSSDVQTLQETSMHPQPQPETMPKAASSGNRLQQQEEDFVGAIRIS
nr:DUF4177 domain-containing protein [uncultured Desulfobulbus sp.]